MQQKNEPFEESKSKINQDFAFVFVEPIYHSKYRLVANILYLLMYGINEIDEIAKEYFIFLKNPNLLEKLLSGVLQGFEAHYKLDTDDENVLNKEMKYQFEKRKRQNSEDKRKEDTQPQKVMHFVFMEMFLLVIDVMEMEREKYSKLEKELRNATNKKQQYSLSKLVNTSENKLKKLLKLLTKINIFYDKDSRLLQKDEFIRIPRERFFLPDKDMK